MAGGIERLPTVAPPGRGVPPGGAITGAGLRLG